MKKNIKHILIIFLSFLSIGMISIGLFFMVKKYIPELENLALFGDSFGFVNTLFSGLALITISYSIILQLNAFKLQQKELQLTREEFKKTAEAQIESQKEFQKQTNILALQSIISAYSRLENNKILSITEFIKYSNRSQGEIREKYLEMHSDYKKKVKPYLDQLESKINNDLKTN